jgi:pimeloyl-ACP methyl ester carboxylesterase
VATFHYQSLGGLHLVYEAWGPIGAPSVVLLHGFLDHGLAFAPVARALADRYRLLAPDQRGHGRSGWIGSGGYYHFPDYVLDLDRFFEHAGLDKVALIGHSMGATVAAYFAGAFPERVASLVLIDSLGPPELRPAEVPGRLRQWIGEVRRRESTPVRPLSDLDEAARRLRVLAPKASDAVIAELALAGTSTSVQGGTAWRYDPLHRTTAPTPFDTARYCAFLSRIRCPTLVVWSASSPFRWPDVDARTAHLIDHEVVTVDGCGHNLHHEVPERLAAILGGFLDRRYHPGVVGSPE